MAGAVIGGNTVSMGTAVTLWSADGLVQGDVTLVTGACMGSNTVSVNAVTNWFADGAALGSVAVGTGAGVRGCTGGVDAGHVADRNTVEVLICSIALIAFKAMRGVVGGVVLLADTVVVRVAVSVDAGGVADGGDAGVRSFGVEVRGGEAVALVRGDAFASVAASATDSLADVELTVVLPAVAADCVVRPSQICLQ